MGTSWCAQLQHWPFGGKRRRSMSELVESECPILELSFLKKGQAFAVSKSEKGLGTDNVFDYMRVPLMMMMFKSGCCCYAILPHHCLLRLLVGMHSERTFPWLRLLMMFRVEILRFSLNRIGLQLCIATTSNVGIL
ncbi:hypothetical protein GOP47_0004866 [Adiantum capillus-veneris]|uniref:Uncharacterized protein n=1 Tax=Adiantum capillus-veneris TaxID=13818 RepID=A0A9D4ZMN9_ADICA|nr:hypothetical protein GOP47_0004866 [Adiantum capillus-veneris]